ncbi:MAG: hypothetical protein ACYCTE_10465 [Acidimicrobiales bacterium]
MTVPGISALQSREDVKKIRPTTAAASARCLCGKELAQHRGYDGRVRYVHVNTGKVECYPESLNAEDARYYRATSDGHVSAA